MNTEKNLIEKVNNWIKNSATLKLVVITILMLLLLMPVSMIVSIIGEREQLNNQAIEEVSSKWAESQQINGPVLTIPLIYENEKEGNLFILPDQLKIAGEIQPQRLRRGIYEIVVYGSSLSVSGDFVINLKPHKENLKEIKFDEAFLTIGISDMRGIKNQIKVLWNKDTLDVNPGSKLSDLIYSGVTIDVPNLERDYGQTIKFEFLLDLQGSQNLSFIPIGNMTNVQIKSDWESPSFNGNFLPDSRILNSNGFSASWSILQLNRNFPQSWFDDDLSAEKMEASSFGVDLLLPLDDYQKSIRSAKYAIMTIALTFLIFFLVEILNKIKIHPFQYALVGLALCLFYILLVSISEHSNFNFAYGISTLGIITMVSLYSLSFFKKRRFIILLTSTLLGIYGFLFVILQLVDYALLMGSIGLMLILGATMYFTRNVNWYNLNIEDEGS